MKNGILVYDDALVMRVGKNEVRMSENWRKQCMREEQRDKQGNLRTWVDEGGRSQVVNHYRRKLEDNVVLVVFPSYLEFRVRRMFEDVRTTPYQKMMRGFHHATKVGILEYNGAYGLDSRNCKESQRHKLNRVGKLARFERDVMFVDEEIGSVFYAEMRAKYGAYKGENTVYVRQSKDSCSIKVYDDERFSLFGDDLKIKLEFSVMTRYLRDHEAQTPKLWHTVIPKTVGEFMDTKLNGVLSKAPETRRLLSARFGCRERDISSRVFAVENTLSYVIREQDVMRRKIEKLERESMRVSKLEKEMQELREMVRGGR
jgi:hypothetical protein